MNLSRGTRRVAQILAALCLYLLGGALYAQVPHPRDVFGFTPGDDYKLATYNQMLDYYQRLDEASERVQVREIGKSVLDKPLLLLFISSEENLRNLARWRQTSSQLARAQIDDTTATRLAREGKSIIWIDGGLHATEVAHAQMTTLLAYKVATEESPEMRKIRDHVILLLMPVMNPDGLDIVAAWYKRNLGTPFETTRPPWLYHHYIGHDNNRDWFMNNMPESEAVTRILYTEWYPQIVYNHHQTSPSWTRIFLPPFADPVNPNIHPGVTTGVNLVGSAMANRFAIEKMPGVVSDVIFSMWWNGGMRTVPYFHNMIGILTETGHATPSPRFFDPDSIPKKIAGRRGGGMPTDGTDIFYPYPWKGGWSHFRDPINYMLTASMAVLRLGADLREQWLYGIYSMGRDAIAGAESEGPYAYVVPLDQWNAGEEVNLLNILRIGGIEIHRATSSFKAADKRYPQGSFIVYSAQAFRPYLSDLLEKQVYPERRSAGGQPETPYDLAGWTLPMQMGVQVDKVETEFAAETEVVDGPVQVAGGVVSSHGNYGYLLSHRPNASIRAVNLLLNAGTPIFWLKEPVKTSGRQFDPGTFVIQANDSTHDYVGALASELGLDFIALQRKPAVEMELIKYPRVALYKSWAASMDEGWTRWLLTEYSFVADTLHDADMRTADLGIYDAIILPSQSSGRMLNGHGPGTMPQEFTGGLGLEGAMALKKYVTSGGTIVALDAACDFAIDQFGLPVRNAVNGVSARQFFIPGSLVRVTVDTGHELAYGMPGQAAASFVRSRAFDLIRLSRKGEGGKEEIPEAPRPDVEIVARYAKEEILMSGWAMGEKKHIGGKAAMIRVGLGEGRVVLFGFRPQFRGQPRGTYKLFFNALLASTVSSTEKNREDRGVVTEEGRM